MIENQARMFTVTKNSDRNCSQGNKVRKGNNKPVYWKGKNKMVLICS